MDIQNNAVEAAIENAIVGEILSAEATTSVDTATALAQANGYDADQAQAQAPAGADDEDQAPAVDPNATFQDLFDAISDTEAKDATDQLLAAFAQRAQYEREKNPANEKIQTTISGLIKGVTPGVVKAMIVSKTDAGVVNKMEVSNNRRNVYALQKMRDILYGAITGTPTNAVNRAILRSMVKLGDVQIPFTGEIAKCCVSDKLALPNANLAAHMVRHTVAEGTASTQMSSTMTALEDLGAVTNKGSRQHPIFEFTETPLAKHLVDMVRKKMNVAVAA